MAGKEQASAQRGDIEFVSDARSQSHAGTGACYHHPVAAAVQHIDLHPHPQPETEQSAGQLAASADLGDAAVLTYAKLR
jgi:hypothetical protein